jgi:vacuolar-type H+-ATPase subunit H
MREDGDVQFTPAPDAEVAFSPSPDLHAGSTRRGSGADSAIGQAKDRAEDLMETAQHRAKNVAESKLSAGKEQAVDRLSGVAQGLRSSSDQFGNQETIQRLVSQAADRVGDFANHLRNRDVPELIDEVEDFARRQPAAFLGGAFAMGLLGARFLKSSRDNLVDEGVRGRWSTERLTSRVHDSEDAIGRPNAPGYEPPSDRMR